MSLVKIEDLYASAHMQYGQSPRFMHLSAFHFESFDFSTLYICILLSLMKKNNLRNLIQEAFKVKTDKYLIINTDGKAQLLPQPSL